MIQQFKAAKQLIDMQKATFDGMVGSMIMFWDQTGNMVEIAIGFPEEGKKAFKQWIEMNKQACMNLKNVVDSGFVNLQKAFGTETPQS
ncbi:MAG: hypothetical protein AAGU11_02825 [Syntrophobacteraceae bacterium]